MYITYKGSLCKAVLFLFASLFSDALIAQSDVLTYHNDLARTGANVNETILTPANVNSTSFGKLFSHQVDGYIYAQPLYMAGVPISGQGRHNVVFVATEGDSIYAFDADNAGGAGANPLWRISFSNGPNVGPIPAGLPNGADDLYGCLAINPQIGITGTPVIDPQSMTLYVVAATKEISGNSINYVHRLHAIDVTTGLEKPGSGMAVSAPAGVAYYPQYMLQRTALLLFGGKIYVGFASACDRRPYNGMLVTFDASTLQQTTDVLVPSPGDAGGLWGGGGAPAVDSTGNIFLGVGNGNFDGTTNFGSALLKVNAQLKILDYFSPDDVNSILNPNDRDLGSSMPIILPDSTGSSSHPHLMVIGGKEGLLYLLDRDNLKQSEPASNTFLPSPPQWLSGGMFGRGVYFNGKVFVPPGYGNVQSFSVSNAQLAYSGGTTAHYGPWTGPSLSLSANGSSTGILWVLSASGDGYSSGTTTAVLDAYDPANLQSQFYTSQNSTDIPGGGVRWAVPTIAQGKVYVGATADAVNGTIATFGLKAPLCAADVSSGVGVARGGWHYSYSTNTYNQTLTLTNQSSQTLGPISIALDNLSSFAQLSSASGTTTCGTSTGVFYQNLATASHSLLPGQIASVTISVRTSGNQTISFGTRILAGSGIR